MNKITKEWVAALRSGKYKQGCGRLRNKKNEFCCLGVLADILNAKWEPLDGRYYIISNEFVSNARMRKNQYISVLPSGILDDEVQTALAEMNDYGISFESIAAHIEEDNIEVASDAAIRLHGRV